MLGESAKNADVDARTHTTCFPTNKTHQITNADVASSSKESQWGRAFVFRFQRGRSTVGGAVFHSGERDLVVVIVFTELEPDIIRVISLRKATSYERQRLDTYLQNRLV